MRGAGGVWNDMKASIYGDGKNKFDDAVKMI